MFASTEIHEIWAADGMRASTSGKSVDVLLEPIWDLGLQSQTLYAFNVSFLKPGTQVIQADVDYSFVIKCDKCNVGATNPSLTVFSDPPKDQPLIHSGQNSKNWAPGGKEQVVFDWDKQGGWKGDHTITITVAGIDNKAINPETATFHVKVTPEFPVGVVGFVIAATMIGVVVLSRKSNIGSKM